MGRTHDGGGHEALHHIPGDDYRRQAARVIRPPVVGRGAELFQSARAARIGLGVRMLLDGPTRLDVTQEHGAE